MTGEGTSQGQEPLYTARGVEPPRWRKVVGRVMLSTATIGTGVAGVEVYQQLQSPDEAEEVVAPGWHPIEGDDGVVCVDQASGAWAVSRTAESSEKHYDPRMKFANVSVTPTPAIEGGATVAVNTPATPENPTAKLRVDLTGGVAKVTIGADTIYPGAPYEKGDDDKLKTKTYEKPEGCEPEVVVDTTVAPVETTVAPVDTTVAPVETTVAPVATTSPTTAAPATTRATSPPVAATTA